MLKKFRISLFAAIVALAANAESVADLPLITINGNQYHYYDVKPHETVFSIAQRLGVSRDEIIDYNPSAADVLQAYSRLYFPVKAAAIQSSNAASSSNAVTHTVKAKETIYGISKAYGVTVDRVIELNPSARDGIKAGQVLIIDPGTPAQEVKAVENPAHTGQNAASANGTHTIAQGETLYRIATNNGITVDELISANPSLDPIDYQAGTVIKIPATKTPARSERPSMPTSAVPASNPTAPVANQAAPAANPAAAPGSGDVNLGSVIQQAARNANDPQIPAMPASNPSGAMSAAIPGSADINLGSVIQQEARNVNDPQMTITPVQQPADREYTVAVMLPLMLNDARPSRSAEMFTDFYRGFLLGVKALAKDGPRLKIHAYDTSNNIDSVRKIMTLPEVKAADIIIGPENDEQFDYVACNANELQSFVVNVFATRNERQVEKANIVQTNIPREAMYDRTIDAFLEEYKGVKPVFLSRVNSTPDKDEFVNLLRERLRKEGVPFTDIAFRDVLNDTDLQSLRRDSAYVFVPTSSHQNEFIKIVPAIKKFREISYYPARTGVFGYPEWLKFRGDIADGLPAVNATIYSRFYRNDNSPATRSVANDFIATYGHPMIASEPSTAILGYDIAGFIINSLRHNGADFHNGTINYQGLQSGFFLDNSNIEGLENNALILIRYRQGREPDVLRI